MKKQKHCKKVHKNAKILGAILLGALAISSGVLAMPIKSSAFNEMITMVTTSAQDNQDYIQQWNKEFSEGYKGFDEKAYLASFEADITQKATNEGAVFEALKKKDYKGWIEAMQNLEGYPGDIELIPKEEFEILAEIKK